MKPPEEAVLLEGSIQIVKVRKWVELLMLMIVSVMLLMHAAVLCVLLQISTKKSSRHRRMVALRLEEDAIKTNLVRTSHNPFQSPFSYHFQFAATETHKVASTRTVRGTFYHIGGLKRGPSSKQL